MSYAITHDHTTILEADDLMSLLKRAWQDAGYSVHNLEVDRDDVITLPDETRQGPIGGQSIVRGNGEVIMHDGSPAGAGTEYLDFEFEVNLGTHKDTLVVLDELEVVIDWSIDGLDREVKPE